MYEINDSTPIGVLTVGQFKGLVNEVLEERVKQLSNTLAPPQKEILTIGEVSEYIGQSKSHIYKLTSLFKIPYYKKGKRLYFRRAQIDEWMTDNRISTVDEIIAEANNFQLK